MSRQTYAPQVLDSEVEYNEQVINERDQGVRGIEQGVHELNEIFHDLTNIVTQQQTMFDDIESNVLSVSNTAEGADYELRRAARSQKARGRRMLCLLITGIVILMILIIAILS